METPSSLADKAAQLTADPGVYLMKDRQGSVIYVGKAKSLRARVKSYFQRPQDSSHKTRLLVSRIADIETIITASEKEALILENSLIKQYRPRFNVQYRDDKDYPYLRLATQEPYPNLTVVRKPRQDSAMYFGPFASAQSVRETLRVIHRLFPLRKCSGKRLERSRPCIYHQLGQCPAPCCRQVPAQQYRRIVQDVQLFLQGRSSEVLQGLAGQMAQAAASLDFELAARLRDQIRAIEQTLARQVVVSQSNLNRDVFAFCRDGSDMSVAALFVRRGRVLGSRSFFLRNLQLDDAEVLSSFIAQYYHQGEFVPDEVISALSLADQQVLGEWLRDKKGTPVAIICPQRGARRELLDMAGRNAAAQLQSRRRQAQDDEAALEELRQRLHLANRPGRIECFDISTIGGTAAVGALVVFQDGRPHKSGYRRFRIQGVAQPDDYAMMHEVLDRRCGRLIKGAPWPDLMIVDGGKGQLNVLRAVLQNRGISGVEALALAKAKPGAARRRRPPELEQERIFLPHRKNPILFPRHSPALMLLQRIRDEAHRFAISYHKSLKRSQDVSSQLEHIPGIGPRTARVLLTHFGSVAALRAVPRAALQAVAGVSAKQAASIYEFFHASPET